MNSKGFGRLQTLLVVSGFLLIGIGVSVAINMNSPISDAEKSDTTFRPAAVPFNIKANEAIGVALGGAIEDLPKKWARTNCMTDKDDGSVFCIISPDEDALIDGAKVSTVTLRYFRDRLINIDYSLTSIDWSLASEALKFKFGDPEQIDRAQVWRNSVSTLRLDIIEGRGMASLQMQLDRETVEWLNESAALRRAKAKKSL
jgi:hypothetical protein